MISAELLYEENYTEPSTFIISIAISKYHEFDDLPNAIRDAELMIDVLNDKYKINEVIRLHKEDFSEVRIIDEFARLKKIINEKDSVIIIYNGHGALDHNNSFYFVPSYGKLKQSNTWYLGTHFLLEINQLVAKHVAVILNCCESGRLIGSGINIGSSFTENNESSRMIFTSGRITQDVYDSFGNTQNSPFIEAFVKCLITNQEEKISFLLIADFVIGQLHDNNLYQNPTLGILGGHQGGLLRFYLKKDEDQYWNEAISSDSIESYEKYLTAFTRGKHGKRAKSRYDELVDEKNNWIQTLEFSKRQFEDFLFKFSGTNGKFKDEISFFVGAINKQIGKIKLEEDSEKTWLEIKNSDEIVDFIRFNENFPLSRHFQESIRIQIKLEKKIEEKSDWKAIKKQAKPKAYREKLITYIKDHPFSEYIRDANLKVADIEEFIKAEKDRDIVRLREYFIKENAIYKKEAQNLLNIISNEERYKELKEELDSAIETKEYYNILYIKNEIELFGNHKQSREMKSLYEHLNELIKSFEQVMQEDFNKAIKSQSLTRLYNFIDDFKEGHLVEEALVSFKNLESEYYFTANTSDSIESFEFFISEFSPFKDNKRVILDLYGTAFERLHNLKYDKMIYDQAVSLSELENYIDKSMKGVIIGKYETQAQERVVILKMNLERRRMYEQISSEPSIELCEIFISKFTNIEDEIYQSVASIFNVLKRNEKRNQRYQDILNEEDTSMRLKMAKDFASRYTNESDIDYAKKVEEIITNSSNEQKWQKIKMDQAEYDQAIVTENLEEKIRLISLYLSREDCIKKEEAQLVLDALIIEKQDIEDFKHIKDHEDSIEAWERFITASIQSERRDYAINRKNQLLEQREEENSYQ